MKTKYILHGGDAHTINFENEKFYKEILKNTKDDLKILLIHFADDPSRAQRNKEADTFQFNNVKNGKNLMFEIANNNIFIEQIKRSDVVYFGGGTTVRLLEVMKKYKNLKELFTGKIIAGESAGMNFLASYCYSKSGGGIMTGSGIIPVVSLPHYHPRDEEKLKNVPENMEKLLLPSFNFKVFYI